MQIIQNPLDPKTNRPWWSASDDFVFDQIGLDLGGTPILRDINLAFRRRETVAIIGESGCGKTTLLKIMIGLLEPTHGRSLFRGKPLNTMNSREQNALRRNFGFLFQAAALFDSMSVYDNVAFGLRTQGILTEKEIEPIVTKQLEEVGLSPSVGDKFPGELSGGMRKRVGLARALALNPEFMLFDEPTTGLDPVMTDVINELILKVRRNLGITGIIVTHEMRTVRKVADRVIMLSPVGSIEPDENQVLFDGSVAELDLHPDPRVRGFIEGDSQRNVGPRRVAPPSTKVVRLDPPEFQSGLRWIDPDNIKPFQPDPFIPLFDQQKAEAIKTPLIPLGDLVNPIETVLTTSPVVLDSFMASPLLAGPANPAIHNIETATDSYQSPSPPVPQQVVPQVEEAETPSSSPEEPADDSSEESDEEEDPEPGSDKGMGPTAAIALGTIGAAAAGALALGALQGATPPVSALTDILPGFSPEAENLDPAPIELPPLPEGVDQSPLPLEVQEVLGDVLPTNPVDVIAPETEIPGPESLVDPSLNALADLPMEAPPEALSEAGPDALVEGVPEPQAEPDLETLSEQEPEAFSDEALGALADLGPDFGKNAEHSPVEDTVPEMAESSSMEDPLSTGIETLVADQAAETAPEENTLDSSAQESLGSTDFDPGPIPDSIQGLIQDPGMPPTEESLTQSLADSVGEPAEESETQPEDSLENVDSEPLGEPETSGDPEPLTPTENPSKSETLSESDPLGESTEDQKEPTEELEEPAPEVQGLSSDLSEPSPLNSEPPESSWDGAPIEETEESLIEEEASSSEEEEENGIEENEEPIGEIPLEANDLPLDESEAESLREEPRSEPEPEPNSEPESDSLSDLEPEPSAPDEAITSPAEPSNGFREEPVTEPAPEPETPPLEESLAQESIPETPPETDSVEEPIPDSPPQSFAEIPSPEPKPIPDPIIHSAPEPVSPYTDEVETEPSYTAKEPDLEPESEPTPGESELDPEPTPTEPEPETLFQEPEPSPTPRVVETPIQEEAPSPEVPQPQNREETAPQEVVPPARENSAQISEEAVTPAPEPETETVSPPKEIPSRVETADSSPQFEEPRPKEPVPEPDPVEAARENEASLPWPTVEDPPGSRAAPPETQSPSVWDQPSFADEAKSSAAEPSFDEVAETAPRTAASSDPLPAWESLVGRDVEANNPGPVSGNEFKQAELPETQNPQKNVAPGSGESLGNPRDSSGQPNPFPNEHGERMP